MRILLAAIHYPVASGRYMADAFKRLGHDVRTIGDSTGPHIWGGQVDPRYTWLPDGGLTAYWPDWTPDLVLLMDSAFAYHHPIYANVPHAVYGVDNHVRNYRQAGILRYFLGHKAVSIQPFEDDVEWLPCGYDPQWFTPSPIPYAEREYDVCMIGVMYPKRAELLNALTDAGLKCLAGTGALYGEYRDAYHNSRISLCSSAAGDVAQRIFETAAMGCVILTDPLADLESIIGPKEERECGIYVYNAIEEAVELAKFCVHPDQSEDWEFTNHIGDWIESGQNWHTSPPSWNLTPPPAHTWDARAQRIAEWWAEVYAPKPEPKRKSSK